MRFPICVACGAKEDLQHHHVVTRKEGGSDDPTNLITLCFGCHLKVHGRQKNGAYNASQQTKAGIAAAKARGIKFGGPNAGGIKNRDEAKARAEALKPILKDLAGKSANAIARELNTREVPTPSGGPWYAQTVIRVQRRLRGAAA